MADGKNYGRVEGTDKSLILSENGEFSLEIRGKLSQDVHGALNHPSYKKVEVNVGDGISNEEMVKAYDLDGDGDASNLSFNHETGMYDGLPPIVIDSNPEDPGDGKLGFEDGKGGTLVFDPTTGNLK